MNLSSYRKYEPVRQGTTALYQKPVRDEKGIRFVISVHEWENGKYHDASAEMVLNGIGFLVNVPCEGVDCEDFLNTIWENLRCGYLGV